MREDTQSVIEQLRSVYTMGLRSQDTYEGAGHVSGEGRIQQQQQQQQRQRQQQQKEEEEEGRRRKSRKSRKSSRSRSRSRRGGREEGEEEDGGKTNEGDIWYSDDRRRRRESLSSSIPFPLSLYSSLPHSSPLPQPYRDLTSLSQQPLHLPVSPSTDTSTSTQQVGVLGGVRYTPLFSRTATDSGSSGRGRQAGYLRPTTASRTNQSKARTPDEPLGRYRP